MLPSCRRLIEGSLFLFMSVKLILFPAFPCWLDFCVWLRCFGNVMEVCVNDNKDIVCTWGRPYMKDRHSVFSLFFFFSHCVPWAWCSAWDIVSMQQIFVQSIKWMKGQLDDRQIKSHLSGCFLNKASSKDPPCRLLTDNHSFFFSQGCSFW